ncbi:MAG: class I SAM-dependent methyltransferase [Motiliproteus sp.]
MAINTTLWNRIRYTLYAPVYDWAASLLGGARRLAIAQLAPQAGEKILLLGCGTGLDLEYFPQGVEIVAVDLTPAMVERTRRRAQTLGLNVEALVMDAEHLRLETEQFDAVVMHLILAVIPDPHACIKEAERVLKPGGRVSVLDKFVPPGQRPGAMRKVFNIFTSTLFSDITRSLELLLGLTRLQVTEDKPALLNGAFRAVTAIEPA